MLQTGNFTFCLKVTYLLMAGMALSVFDTEIRQTYRMEKRMKKDFKLRFVLTPVSLDFLCQATETVTVRSIFARHKATFFFKRLFQYISMSILIT